MLLSELGQQQPLPQQHRRRPFSQFSSSMRSCRRRLSRRPPMSSPPPAPLAPSYNRKRRSSVGLTASTSACTAAVGGGVSVPRSFNFCASAAAAAATPPRSPAPKRRCGLAEEQCLGGGGSVSGGLFRRLRDSLRRPFLGRSGRPRKYRLNAMASTSSTTNSSSSIDQKITSSASLCRRAGLWRLRGVLPSPSPSPSSSRVAAITPMRCPPKSPLTFASASAACHRMMASARCHGYGSAAGPTGRPSPSHQYQQQQQQPHRAPLGAYNLPQPASHASGGSREHASVAQYYEPVPHSLPVQYYQQQQQQQQPPLSPQQQQQPVGLKTSTKKASDSVLWEKQAADSGHSASIVSGSPYYSAAVVPNPTAVGGVSVGFSQQQQQQPAPSQPPPLGARSSRDRASYAQGTALSGSEQPVQCSSSGATPTQARKSRRRSNLFSRKEESAAAAVASASAAAATTSATPAAGPCSIVGSGRAIPLKQGVLSKRSGGGALSRSDWKEKYAALSDDGLLTYYASQRDYRADSHGKSIDLSRTTVKVPGQTRPTSNGLLLKTQHSQHQPASQQQQQQHPHRRAKSSGRAGVGADTARTPDDDGSSAAGSSGAPPASSDCEFTIVSLDSRTWQFRASSLEERDDWVRAIKQGIEVGLQLLGRDGQPAGRNGNSSGVGGGGGASVANISPSSTSSGTSGAAVQLLRDILGNDRCADCGRPDPDWASINLGVLLCIECSGAHRQLGTHLSRVRSLALDDWPANHALVMRVIGNRLANSVWEARLGSAAKPGPESPRECKEQFIRAKYEKREFLPELPYADCPVQQQLVDAIARSDTRQVILCLALAGPAINRPYSQQDPRAAVHIAATLGQLPYLQLLLWYGADPAVRDAEGRTGHFYAAAAGKPECAEFLLLAGCPPTASGQSAYQSASGRRRSSRSAASPTSPATVEIGL